MKTLKIEYFIIPTYDSKYVGECIYRLRSPKTDWMKTNIPFKTLRDPKLLTGFFSDWMLELEVVKIKLYECKLVRVKCQKKPKK